jgi:heme/copper-type cytochrome/quinol oxidase subunit 2
MARNAVKPSIAFRLAACALVLSLAGAVDVVSAAEVTFALRIQNGRVPQNMRLIRVKRNDVVKLQWTTDKPMSLHLHGYDIEKQVVPGAVTEMVFTARATGRFTVEPHLAKQSGGHAHGDILVTIEVYP